MPNIIELNLLENKSIVATMQGYPLGNENSYKIIAGEENATKFIIKSIPNQYANARLTVEMVNSQGLGIAERELSEIEVDLVSYKGFVLPKGMAVAGYGYILIRAYIEEEVAVFQPLKLKVWNTIPQWQDYVDKTTNAKVVDGYLILTENGNEYNLGYVQGEKGDMPDMSAYYTKAETDANLAEIERDIKVLGNALMQGGITYKPTTEDTYNERITAEGVNVVDGSEAVLQKVVGSTVRCENLIPYPYVDKTKELNGVILTVNDDRSVKIQGTATASIQFKAFRGKLPIGQYTLSSNAVEIGENSDSYGKLILRVSKNNAWYAEGKTVTFSVENETDVFDIYYYVNIGNTVNVTIRPMLNEGSTAKPYQPYFTGLKSASFGGIESTNADGTETSTLVFPKTETPLGTTIDFENKKIIEGSKEIVLDGTENWTVGDTQTAGKIRFCLERWLNEKSAGTISTINSVSSMYDSTTAEHTYLNKNGLSVSGRNVWVYDETYATKTVDEFKAHIAELYASGNPVVVRYLLATPTERDFTDEETAKGKKYLVQAFGTEKVIDNDGKEYGADNTLTQDYIAIKE